MEIDWPYRRIPLKMVPHHDYKATWDLKPAFDYLKNCAEWTWQPDIAHRRWSKFPASLYLAGFYLIRLLPRDSLKFEQTLQYHRFFYQIQSILQEYCSSLIRLELHYLEQFQSILVKTIPVNGVIFENSLPVQERFDLLMHQVPMKA